MNRLKHLVRCVLCVEFILLLTLKNSTIAYFGKTTFSTSLLNAVSSERLSR